MKKRIYLPIIAILTLLTLMLVDSKFDLRTLGPSWGAEDGDTTTKKKHASTASLEPISFEDAQVKALDSVKALFSDIAYENEENMEKSLKLYEPNESRNEPTTASEFISFYYPYQFYSSTTLTIMPIEDIDKDAYDAYGTEGENNSIWVSSRYDGSDYGSNNHIFVMNRAEDGEFYLAHVLYYDKKKDEGNSIYYALKEGVRDVYYRNGLPYKIDPAHQSFESYEGFITDDEVIDLIDMFVTDYPDEFGTIFHDAQRRSENEFFVNTDKVESIVNVTKGADGKLEWGVYDYASMRVLFQSDNWDDDFNK